ncbi:MAG: DUF5611 family protein [Euryarchaeota archaeon]|nr:DUF5611 family protein [Euryarchaeota archaeon]
MKGYSLKKGYKSVLREIPGLLQKYFPNSKIYETDDGKNVMENYGALRKLVVEVQEEKLFCQTETQTEGVNPEMFKDAINRYNSFVKEATGLKTLLTTKPPRVKGVKAKAR